ncbi:unnamed protein product, partial [Mesorhabditis belari]|uniref:Elongation of very long chain fatty acids protein n=1 Tax=Mesorhabditis belari TaxID=2138241 RepID=A0AAF3EPI6_9BILA
MDLIHQLNDFTLYRRQNETFHSGYRYENSLSFETLAYPMEMTLWFQNNWHHSITISVVYYILIRSIQRLMRDRQAFTLEIPLFYWNSFHAIYSTIAFARLAEDVGHSYSISFYDAICRTCHPNDAAAFWNLTFAISKIIELGDTLFIVLRKKPLIFLHYYHHAAVLIYTVHSGAEHIGVGRSFIMMNLFAHALMYTYYATKTTKLQIPRWVAMVVTTVQTTQMLLGVLLSACVYWIKTNTDWRCQQSMGNLYLAFVIYVTFGVLFAQFFYKAYLRPRNQKTKKLE